MKYCSSFISKYIFYIILISLVISCKAQNQLYNHYKILNLVEQEFIASNKRLMKDDTLFFEKVAKNLYLKEKMEAGFQKELSTADYNLILSPGDLDYMIEQLKKPFEIDANMLISKDTKIHNSSYYDTIQVPNLKESVDRYRERINWSRPIFTKNEQWAFIGVYDQHWSAIRIFEKKNGKWVHYKDIDEQYYL